MAAKSRSGVRTPILWVALGRQRVGKTALLNSAVQFFREAGNVVRVWNADQQNKSHTLSLFFPDAEHVPEGGIEDAKVWIEERLSDQIEKRYNAVLDVGGGATGFSKLVQEVPVLEATDASAIRVVGLFCTGPEKADLDYLEQYAETDMFMPAASMIVLNAGLILSGRSAKGAFGPVVSHPAVVRALERGAETAMFPHLACMAQVTDRGLTFREAMDGKAKGDLPPLSLFDRARVNRWWSRDIPSFFGGFPADWLPVDQSVAPQAVAAEAD